MKAFFLPICLALVVSLSTRAWQDDVVVNLRDSTFLFSNISGFDFFNRAQAEIRLGRYLSGSKNQAWRGGAEGDIALLSFNDNLVWHMGLNMETLADNQNDIHFRLVQVYYQALTGIKWKLHDHVFHFGYRHRCNHGTDEAEKGRITIRSGPTFSYHWVYFINDSISFALMPGLNVYVLGQNSDLSFQPKGNAFISSQFTLPFVASWQTVVGLGLQGELVGRGHNWVYGINHPHQNLHVEPLFAARVALRVNKKFLKSDFAFHFAQNLDSGLEQVAKKSTSFSFDVDFMW
jgi:hypothetical protein